MRIKPETTVVVTGGRYRQLIGRLVCPGSTAAKLVIRERGTSNLIEVSARLVKPVTR